MVSYIYMRMVHNNNKVMIISLVSSVEKLYGFK